MSPDKTDRPPRAGRAHPPQRAQPASPASPSGRPSRGEPREVAELKQIKSAQPELAGAVDMQLALLDLQRRVQARVPLPWIEVDPAWLKACRAEGRPLLRFEDIPLDWTDFRLMVRQTADILRRYDALEANDYQRIQSLAREGHALEPIVVRWYNSGGAAAPVSNASNAGNASNASPASPESPAPNLPEMLDQVLALAMRPFLARCVEVALQRADIGDWRHPRCPLCGGEPEFAYINQAADRLLICGRCTGPWRFHPLACPFCGNDDRTRITSFASRDGRYRIYACDVCRRYLKAYDGRQSSRPVMLAVDSIATLPLDAAAQQKGYRP